MNWDDVRIFLAVARQGQLLAAGRTLGVNHATVSRRLRALEKGMGSLLVRRRTNGTELTAEGERFLPHAEAMEAAMLAAAEASEADRALAGTVRIGAPDGFGVSFLAGQLGELVERYPALRLELVPVPRTFSLSRREADIAIMLEQPQEGRLVSRKLVDYGLSLYAAPRYLAAAGRPQSLAELEHHRLVGYVEDLLYARALDYTGEFVRDWRPSLSVSSALGQIAAVRAGAGIGILHDFMARGDADLVPVLPAHGIRRSYWTVVHEDLRHLRRIAVTADFLSETVTRHRSLF